jgi:hypothetical protein
VRSAWFCSSFSCSCSWGDSKFDDPLRPTAPHAQAAAHYEKEANVMLDQTILQFPDMERDAFREVCLRNGLAPDGFEVSSTEHFSSGAPSEALDRSVIVRMGKTMREYDGAHGPDWTVDFEHDIRSHVFG